MARGQGGGPYQIKAAIAALHAAPGPVDWAAILGQYDRLMRHEPTDVVRLNRAVALAEAGRPAEALDVLAALAGTLAAYQPFHAAQAHVLARAGQPGMARAAYDTAIRLAASEADARLLQKRRDSLAG
jgi:RNA polymerase sigma-70 factor (ECF subfamily)